MVDTRHLECRVERCAGSSPVIGTRTYSCPPQGILFSRCWASLKTVYVLLWASRVMVTQRAVNPWLNCIVGSSPTSLTRSYCLPVSSAPCQINGLETGFICASSSTDKSTRLRPVRLGVQIFSGVPSKRENLGY